MGQLQTTCAALRTLDSVAMALDTYAHLQPASRHWPGLGPLPIAERPVLCRTVRDKQAALGPLDDAERTHYAAWLLAATRRTDVLLENVRRLRLTTWAQVTLEAAARHEQARALADWHAERWGLLAVSPDPLERESQIAETLRRLSA